MADEAVADGTGDRARSPAGGTAGGRLALLVAGLRQSGHHLALQLELARTEIDGNLRAVFGLAACLGGILLLALVAMLLTLKAVVGALAALLGSAVLAALIVAAPFLVAAGILGWWGVSRIGRATRA